MVAEMVSDAAVVDFLKSLQGLTLGAVDGAVY